METVLTKKQALRIYEILRGCGGCGAICNIIIESLDNPYCDGFVIKPLPKEGQGLGAAENSNL